MFDGITYGKSLFCIGEESERVKEYKIMREREKYHRKMHFSLIRLPPLAVCGV